MLTKNIPYKAITLPELLMKIINEPIIPPKQFNENITDSVENIIYKATSKKPYERYQNIDGFIDAFDSKDIKEDLVTIAKYYAWVYRELDVTLRFEEHNESNIIYPIHVNNWMKKLHQHFVESNFENVIIDPSTQRLSYFAFASTKGLKELPYAPETGVISLDYLNNPLLRKDYINKWYETVSIGNKLILPYHYISNTDYSVDKIEEWIKINIKLIEESSSIVEYGKEKFAMISIGLSHLVFESKKILSYYMRSNVDGFIV